MYCSNCAKEQPKEASFCMNCGTVVNTIRSRKELRSNLFLRDFAFWYLCITLALQTLIFLDYFEVYDLIEKIYIEKTLTF